MYDIKGRIVIITGSAQGMGKEFAKILQFWNPNEGPLYWIGLGEDAPSPTWLQLHACYLFFLVRHSSDFLPEKKCVFFYSSLCNNYIIIIVAKQFHSSKINAYS